ncbi:Uncharacterised protein [BD1-7 clade bacterium]|uniref:Uncharacterized protein n=1 Tax=BD1-7 clade bacterium TaxID=2029982 RepID=A0A5S9PJY0_9GAMM|nr:Uncharacterised protein [BD1-7 clade bacterium]
MKIEKPQYYVRISMVECPRIVIINGIEIERDDEGYSVDVEIPINHYIRSGINEFSINIGDDSYMDEYVSPNSKCSVSIVLKGFTDGEKVEYVVGDIQYQPDVSVPLENRISVGRKLGGYALTSERYVPSEDGQDGFLSRVESAPDPLDEGGITYTRQFKAELPFEEWPFLSSEVFFEYPIEEESYDQLKQEIWPLVVELWDIFEKKDLRRIREVFEPRSIEYDRAFYKEQGATIDEMMNALEGFYEEGYPLNRLAMEYMELKVSYGGNLVSVVNAGTGNGTILFYDKDTDMNWFFEATWMRKDGQWILTR